MIPTKPRPPVVDLAFATTANVANGATYSSGVLDMTRFAQVQTEIESDQDGTLGFTFYSDAAGTNAVRALSIPYVAESGFQFFAAPTFGSYVKYEFTNTTGTPTTEFWFATKFTDGSISPQLVRTDGYVAPAMVAMVTRSVNHFDLDTARRKTVGQRTVTVTGSNTALTGTWQDVWSGGGDYTWLTTATVVEVVSTDVVDNGTTPAAGCRSVRIYGLDETGVEQEEVVLTNGTAAVQSANSYIRINNLVAETCGTYGGSHQGDITCRVTSGGAALAKMVGEEGAVDTSVQYGNGDAQSGLWTVPLGKVAYLTRLSVLPDVSQNKTVDSHLYIRENILNTTAPVSPRKIIWQATALTSQVDKEFKSHLRIPALTDVWFRSKANGTAAVEVTLDFYIVDEDPAGF